MSEQRRRKRAPRQDWKPHWSIMLLQKLWMVLFTAFKIALGAAATVLMVCLVCIFIFVGLLGAYLEEDILPEAAQVTLDGLEMDLNSQILYLDNEGQIQVQQQIYAANNRKWVELEDVPEDLIHAVVAIEDKRFYEHQGVDWFTTIKACAGMFFGSSTAGGSSITQQMIKNITHNDSVTVQRKVLEIFQAVQLEKKYDKDMIMETYLNVIYLGQGCSGVKTAAAEYFGKELQSLTVNECACLISITNNPSLYDPYLQPTNNRTRRLNVLYEMYDQGWITEAEYNEARSQEMVGRQALQRLLNNPDMSPEEYAVIKEHGIIYESVLDQIMADGVVTQEEYDDVMANCMILKSNIELKDQWAVCESEGCGYQGTVSTFREENGLYYCPNCGAQVEVATSSSQTMYSYFTDTVIIDVAKDLAAKDGQDWSEMPEEARQLYLERIRKGGYNIYSTINMEAQEIAESIYEDVNQIPKTSSGQQLQSAIVIVDVRTGDIVAIVGGVGTEKDYLGWNKATDSRLQSGSSIKPLSVYAPAFEAGAITPATVVKDLPLNYEGNDPWPKNDNHLYSYSRTIFNAVVASVNAVATNTLDLIGVDYAYDFAKDKFGLSSLVDSYVDADGVTHSDRDYAPLSLGAQTWGVRVRDMACGFATLANNGVYRKGRTYTKVYDSNGNIVLDNVQESQQVLSEKAVNYMNYCLVNAVNGGGTGYEAQLRGVTAAGKTGTTSDNKDRWFCGFTGYYAAAVWCGYDTPEAIHVTSYGVNNPATNLWQKVMARLHEGKANVALYDTSKMTSVTVCLDSGKLATDACKSDPRGISRVATAMVYYEDRPTETCDKHVLVDYCSGGGVATEYCKLFAEVDPSVKIEKKGLLKMTRSEIDEMMKAYNYYEANFKKSLTNNFVYQVDDKGRDETFNGLDNKLVQNPAAPYLVCPVHTRQAWEEYQDNQRPGSFWHW